MWEALTVETTPSYHRTWHWNCSYGITSHVMEQADHRFPSPTVKGARKAGLMQVKDCMHAHVTTVTPDTLVSTADQMMHDRRIRHLPVVTEQHTLVGVFTDRDVRRAEASDTPPMAAHELTYLL